MLNACLLASLCYDQCLGFFDLFQQSQAGELHKFAITLGDYLDDNPWRFDWRLCQPGVKGLSVREKRMFLMPFHIFIFCIFWRRSCNISLCFSIHTTGFGSEAWAWGVWMTDYSAQKWKSHRLQWRKGFASICKCLQKDQWQQRINHPMAIFPSVMKFSYSIIHVCWKVTF